MRKLIVFALLASVLAAVAATSAGARPRGVNGKIVTNSDNLVTGHEEVYTVDPNGTDEQLISSDEAEAGQWSPNGSMFALFSTAGESLFNPDTGIGINYGLPDTRYPGLLLFCGVWSPNGARLACEGFGLDDPSRTGVYTLRASDGGDLQQVTSEPNGDDAPGDYSPNGKLLLITKLSFDPFNYGLYTVRTDGTGLRRILPDGMDFRFGSGSWSPQGNEIVFSSHYPTGDYHSSIWVVHSDGSGLRQLPIAGPCGGLNADPTTIGCFNPIWSPDGTKIVFGRNADDDQRDLYTVNADGSGLFQVTHTPNISEFNGDWGTHPVTP
jgi:Tol biopolymer transport system component